jgi:hypothetical protein
MKLMKATRNKSNILKKELGLSEGSSVHGAKNQKMLSVLFASVVNGPQMKSLEVIGKTRNLLS